MEKRGGCDKKHGQHTEEQQTLKQQQQQQHEKQGASLLADTEEEVVIGQKLPYPSRASQLKEEREIIGWEQ